MKKLFATILILALILSNVIPQDSDIVGDSTNGHKQSVSTDKKDYTPGEKVLITGRGFEPGEYIELLITHIEPNLPDPPHTHDPWSAQTNENGDFSSSWEVGEQELGTTMKLTALGQNSGLEASTIFTDVTYSTRITDLSPSSGDCGTTILVSAYLSFYRTDFLTWYACVNQTITFTLGSVSYTAKTDLLGYAGVTMTVPDPATTLTASYAGGVYGGDPDEHYSASSASISFDNKSILGSTGSIVGNNYPCEGVAVNYSIPEVTNATNYLWTVPSNATVSSGQGSNSIEVVFGPGSGTITVTPSNACYTGSSSSYSITVKTEPEKPGIITGETSVCEGSSQIYSITAVPGATHYTWDLPYGWSGSSYSTSITAIAGENSGNIWVSAVNSCGSSLGSRLSISVSPLPETPTTIYGLATVCEGTSQTYSIASVPNATSYTWTLPPGWSGGSDSESIITTVGAGTGNITVTADNSCGSSVPRSQYLTVTPPIESPGPITGSTSICGESLSTYSISPVTGATSYSWSVPEGWIIDDGQGTTQITVHPGSSGQNGSISVIPNNDWGRCPSFQTLNIYPDISENTTGYLTTSFFPFEAEKISGDITCFSGTLGYLKFPLSAIPSNATITESILNLTHNGSQTQSCPDNLVKALGDNDPVTTEATDLYYAIGSGTYYNHSEWDYSGTLSLILNSYATNDIQSRLSSPGYIAMGLIKGGSARYYFYGYSGGTNAPKLTVNYTTTSSISSNLAVSIDESCIYIPDPNFEQALIDLGIDGDGIINQRILRSEAESVTSLDISDPLNNPDLPNVEAKIENLKGIEAFINITELNCGNNLLTSLDVSQNTLLINLFCDNNLLTTLDILNNSDLEIIWCQHNQINSLNVTSNKVLKYLICHHNLISTINLYGNSDLYSLACGSNLIESIDVSQNSDLHYLACNDLNLSGLDISANYMLRTLVCYNSNLNTLDLTQNSSLVDLVCNDNQLNELDLSANINLAGLRCSNNPLIALDLRNGNNVNLIVLALNTSLACINVDDETADHSSWSVDSEVILSNNCDYNTQRGTSVAVQIVDETGGEKSAHVTFEKVTLSGQTTLEVKSEDPLLPEGFKTLEPSELFDIKTTAEYAGKIEVELDYKEKVVVKEIALRVLHKEEEDWNDVTKSLDITNKTIKGEVSSLSPFVIAEDIQNPVFDMFSDITTPNDPGEDGAYVNFETPTATDNSNVVTIEQIDDTGLSSGSFFPVGITTLKFQATDGAQNTALMSFNVIVTNDAPHIIGIYVLPDPIALGTSVDVVATFTDNNLAQASWNWGDETSSAGTIDGQTITGDHLYEIPGVYVLTLTITDMCGETDSEVYQFVVVYDPSGGFITGGGWINSPPGAYTDDPLLEGKANFGFVSKYKKGKDIPEGNTEFQFHAGNLEFKSSSYYWLVIAGAKAKFKGDGTVNNVGDYGFMISAIDGELIDNGKVDRFRIKIWDMADETVIYDNEIETDENQDPTTELGGGSIVIHIPKTKGSGVYNEELVSFGNDGDIIPTMLIYPNPAKDYMNIIVSGKEEQSIELKIYNSTGQLVHISSGKGMINEEISLEDNKSGLYSVIAVVNNKLIIQKVLIE